MKKHTTTLLLISILASFIFSQKAEVITQQINVENAIREKVERTVEKFSGIFRQFPIGKAQKKGLN